jgi:hypothetical protein
MLNTYPIFFVLAGVIASTLTCQRALILMVVDAKARLIDSSLPTRILIGNVAAATGIVGCAAIFTNRAPE